MATAFFSSCLLFLAMFLSAAVANTHSFFETTTRPPSHKEEKLTKLHFYLHDIVRSKDPTAVVVARAESTNSSSTRFGEVSVVDDPLTQGPDLDSRRLGQAQGMYIFSSKTELSLSIMFNLHFTVGHLNGSSISFIGQDPILSTVREMPIVGGAGVFRMARGYVQFRTHEFDVNIGNAILDVKVHALHY